MVHHISLQNAVRIRSHNICVGSNKRQAFQLAFGKAFRFFSLKWTFLTALLIFEIGSVLCGAATSSAMLIVGVGV